MKQALVGGTVADVYTGTWVERERRDRGRRDHLRRAARSPRARRSTSAGRCWCRATSSPTRTRGACTRRCRCSRSRCPTGRRRSSTTTCSSSSSHGVDGLRTIVDAMRAAPAHIRWVARIAPQSAYPDEAERFAIDTIAPMLSLAGGGGQRRDHELDVGREGRAAGGCGDRGREGRAASASRATTPARPTTASTSCRAAGISADHEAITARRRWTGCGSGMWTMLRQSSLRPGPRADAAAGSRDVIGTRPAADVHHRRRRRRRFYAERGVIGGALRIASEHGVEPMRALQMATIDPATFLGLDEELGGIAPGRARRRFNVLPEVGEWRPETVYVRRARWSRATDGSSPSCPRCRGPRARAWSPPTPALFAPLTGDAARRALRERRDQPPRRPRGGAGRCPRRARRPRRHLGGQGRGRALPGRGRVRHHRDHVARAARARHAIRRRWRARRPGWPRWAAASRSTAAGRRRWRSTG